MSTDILISTIRDSDSGGHSESLPSFYEIILVDQIDNMLKPAFRQFLDVTLNTLPVSMIDLTQLIRGNWEELYDFILLIVQIRLIRYQGASFAERVYGLQRRGIKHSATLDHDKYGKLIIPSSNRMMRWQQDVSIFMVAVLPRLATALSHTAAIVRRRMRIRHLALDAQRRNITQQNNRPTAFGTAHFAGDVSVDELARSTESVALDSTEANYVPWQSRFTGPHYHLAGHNWRSRLVHSATRLGRLVSEAVERLGEATAVAMPYALAGCGAIVTAQRLCYLFGYTPYHHPLLAFGNTALVRRNADLHDLTAGMERGSLKDKNVPNYRFLTLVSLILAIKIMHWTVQQDENNEDGINFTLVGQDTTAHAADPGAEGVGIDGSIIPPPAPPTVGRGRVIPDIDPALRQESCPICKRTPRVSECASTGGYLFCFSCLLESLRSDEARGEIPKCPVTGIPCCEKDIIMMHAGGS